MKLYATVLALVLSSPAINKQKNSRVKSEMAKIASVLLIRNLR